MKISWTINTTDIHKIKKVLKENNNEFVKSRIKLNVEKKNVELSKDAIIKNLLMCLLTSQQRSSPNSLVGKFLQLKPFPITNKKIIETENTEMFIKQILQDNGLTRYINKISIYFSDNIGKIVKDDWKLIDKLEYLNENPSKLGERQMADYLNDQFKGFGPKQSRNFLQALGLTKYEIPIDSRIISWLNKFGFPVSLTAAALSDKYYYHFVLDGIHELCENAKIYPCELDAAIFSSYDIDQWKSENKTV
ncbi:thermostable 8-oxoguanine DNA glycosylase [Ulvibacter sp. MAR_2010_11]|uniref:hypothetical protein n=1 Tax=Ulvibacter sp. MAR_2010_11 TaxID=1250229 RepID=UPI000C2B8E58|nr:hypothetical protein [Ulvibacter sp. MAR_2010_11]PKA82453.1 thermostable 8-oxoguanine DNA glycosylase [Ulvibacter sp. MAR_2010_11]